MFDGFRHNGCYNGGTGPSSRFQGSYRNVLAVDRNDFCWNHCSVCNSYLEGKTCSRNNPVVTTLRKKARESFHNHELAQRNVMCKTVLKKRGINRVMKYVRNKGRVADTKPARIIQFYHRFCLLGSFMSQFFLNDRLGILHHSYTLHGRTCSVQFGDCQDPM